MKTWRQIRQISFCGGLILGLTFGGGSLSTGLAEKETPERSQSEKSKKVNRGGPQQQVSDPVVVRKRKPKPRKRRLNPARPKGPKLEDNFTLAVDIELVNLDVVVTDKRGELHPQSGRQELQGLRGQG